MTAFALTLLLGGTPGLAQPDARLLAEVGRRLADGDFAAVLAVLDAAGPDGSHPALLRLRAEAYVALLDYPAAAAALEGAPVTPDNLALRARLLAILSRDDEARAAVSELLEHDGPLSGAARVELAAQLRESGLAPESRRVLGPPAPGEPAAAVLERARLRIEEDDYEGALPLLEAALEDPRPPSGAAGELGRALALLGRRAEAIPWLRRSVAESPHDAAARFRLGQLLAQDPDPALADEGQRLLSGYEDSRLRERRRDLLLATLGEGGRDEWAELLGLLLDGGDLPEAARVAQAASVRYPEDPVFAIGQARVHLLSGDPGAAAGVLAPLLPGPGEPLEGASLSAARWLADARLRGGDPAAAAALFDRVLAAGGDRVSPRIRAAAATAFAMTGDAERALALFDQVLDRTSGPARAGPLADSALVLEMLGRPAEAESRYRESLEADPANTASSLGLAELLLRAGRSAEAAEVLRSALEYAPDDAALRGLLSRIGGPAQGSFEGTRAAANNSVTSCHASAPRTSVRSSPARSARTSPLAETVRWTASSSVSLVSPPSSISSVTVMVQAAPSPGRLASPTFSASVEFSS